MEVYFSCFGFSGYSCLFIVKVDNTTQIDND